MTTIWIQRCIIAFLCGSLAVSIYSQIRSMEHNKRLFEHNNKLFEHNQKLWRQMNGYERSNLDSFR